MERMLVVVFESEAKAYDGSGVLHLLDEDGSIAVYADGVVAKDPDGTATMIKSHGVGVMGALAGTTVGSLIGLLGGPVGLAVGAATGFAAGAATDLEKTRAVGAREDIKARQAERIAAVRQRYNEWLGESASHAN